MQYLIWVELSGYMEVKADNRTEARETAIKEAYASGLQYEDTTIETEEPEVQ